MAVTGINPTRRRQEEDGGLFGSVLGGALGAIAGAAAAPFTAGASLATIPAAIGTIGGGLAAGAGLGSTAGGLIGKAVDGGQSARDQAVIPTQEIRQTPLSSMKNMPEVQMATMQNSKNLLATSDMPNAIDYMAMIDQAKERLKNRLSGRSSLGGPYG